MGDWPSQRAWELLEELERDPRGCGFLDIEELLDAWGVTQRLPGSEMMGYRSRVHPSAPDFYFHYPARVELGPATIRSICRAVRLLYQRIPR